MGIRRQLLLVLGMLGIAACSVVLAKQASHTQVGGMKVAGESDVAERMAIRDRVRVAVNAEDFASLNSLERQYRTSRSRFESSRWHLMEYYLALSLSIARPVSSDGCRDQSEGLIARWQAFDPQAPAATIYYAEHLLAKGWCVRGSGFAQTVSPQAWKVFHEMSGKALNLLESRNSAAVDPQYYAVMAKIYRATGKDETAMMGLLERAFSAEPGYYETYYAASEYFKPQWNGGPDGYDRFARFAMDRAKKQEGRGMYARLYLYEADCNCRHTLPAPDRELMKEALRDIIVRWPVGRNVNRAIQEACMVQDYAESAELFRLLGSDDAAMGWSSPADQSDCREKTQQWQTLRGRSR